MKKQTEKLIDEVKKALLEGHEFTFTKGVGGYIYKCNAEELSPKNEPLLAITRAYLIDGVRAGRWEYHCAMRFKETYIQCYTTIASQVIYIDFQYNEINFTPPWS